MEEETSDLNIIQDAFKIDQAIQFSVKDTVSQQRANSVPQTKTQRRRAQQKRCNAKRMQQQQQHVETEVKEQADEIKKICSSNIAKHNTQRTQFAPFVQSYISKLSRKYAGISSFNLLAILNRNMRMNPMFLLSQFIFNIGLIFPQMIC